ncbi:hypothetical protein CANCADRAFT_80257 [Tortispora caseinolytica NRRL Y-17796]|uniref:Beta-lactamase-related domain-containing protein n=1 Tax=Tortispora caseinolytica NRRL Y-17796 TaxID=767744 RepID=A0A1E4TJN7_9ASCO|nr:hypothetical protein CANCADRAFT_80257 [Tortispora caseinolytica NRRL Y-17796]
MGIDIAALKTKADAAFEAAVNNKDAPVAGIVAGVTDRNGNIYEGQAGYRNLETKVPMDQDTLFYFWSTSKAHTAAALLHLYEQGKIDFQDPAKKYVKELENVEIFDGFDESGNLKTRPAKKDITIHHLLTHTAGFGYFFFNDEYREIFEKTDKCNITQNTIHSISTPLLFEPGEAWNYGASIDWAGIVLERVSGMRLGDYLKKYFYEPLGMNDTKWDRTEADLARQATHYQRGKDGKLTPLPEIMPLKGEQHMGGHGAIGTVRDYLKFLRMWLNEGRAPDGTQILKPETVKFGMEPKLTTQKINNIKTSHPDFSNDVDFPPDADLSWSYGFLVNQGPFPTGRPAGSSFWAGLANLYYWIDIKNGIAGYYASQVLPFNDVTSAPAFYALEGAVYSSLS